MGRCVLDRGDLGVQPLGPRDPRVTLLRAEEQRKLYLRGGVPWTVSDDPADYPPPVAGRK